MPIETFQDATGHPKHFFHHGAVMRRVFNPVMVRLGRAAVLFVRGRKSGRILAVPMDPPFGWEGTTYLVSPLGETHWARNLRAAGQCELRIKGRRDPFRAVELHGQEHDDILAAYGRTITCGCRTYLARLPDPADHPVFRIERLSEPPRGH
jgi:hypothetical protein